MAARTTTPAEEHLVGRGGSVLMGWSRVLRWLIWPAVVAAVIAGCGGADDVSGVDEELHGDRVDTGSRADLDPNVAFVTESWPTDWSETLIPLDELILGVAATEPRDAIPPIDDPIYESVDDAAGWLADREPGALVRIGDESRFYPLSIMTRHEIVNTEIGETPVAVTYCPLCNSALAFDRRVDGEVLRFGVSGLLRNSDLVMWDDRTVSLWQQLTGEALIGEFAGTKLDLVSTAIVSFGDYRAEVPGGRSLSRQTGFDLDYGLNPYEGYSGRFAPRFPVEGESDDRFFPMERVVGISVGDVNKAYPFSVLAEKAVINDEVDGTEVTVWWGSPDTADALSGPRIADSRAIGTAIAFDRRVDDRVLTFAANGESFVDEETGSTWSILGTATAGPLAGAQLRIVPHRNEFWFAWTAFFPEADVHTE